MPACTRSLVMMVIVCAALFAGAAYLMLLERKIQGWMQGGRGPQQAGPFGVGQPLADAVKLAFKAKGAIRVADPVLYYLAPFIVLVAVMSMAPVIPFGAAVRSGSSIPLPLTDINVGLVYLFAASLWGGGGALLAGWSSRSSGSLLAGLRASMQTMSSDIPLACSCAGAVMQGGSLSLVALVNAQVQQGWFAYHMQGLGFVVFLVCAVMKCNRAPFDQPEASSELGAGYLAEYAGVRYALFRLAEYSGIILMSALMTTLFLGGPVPLPWPGAPRGPLWLGPVWFWLKVLGFCFLFVYLKGAVPRFRSGQAVNLCWKVLFPLSLVNIVLTVVMMME